MKHYVLARLQVNVRLNYVLNTMMHIIHLQLALCYCHSVSCNVERMAIFSLLFKTVYEYFNARLKCSRLYAAACHFTKLELSDHVSKLMFYKKDKHVIVIAIQRIILNVIFDFQKC